MSETVLFAAVPFVFVPTGARKELTGEEEVPRCQIGREIVDLHDVGVREHRQGQELVAQDGESLRIQAVPTH